MTIIRLIKYSASKEDAEYSIPDSVTSIDDEAFRDCSSLQCVNIPDNVTEIGEWAFFRCSSLTSVNLPAELTGISNRVFAYCTSLMSVTVPDNVGYIYIEAFEGCRSLSHVELPNKEFLDGVSSICDGAFLDCPSLKSIMIPASVFFEIGDKALGYQRDPEYISTTPIEGFTIYGYQNTPAEEYAENNSFAFVALDKENPFADVHRGAFYEAPVVWAVKNKVTAGTSPNRFSPNSTCAWAQVVTFLWRAMGAPEPAATDNPFSDVSENQYYYRAVLWALENEITSGTSETTFDPDNGCTRAQAVTFLWRTEGKPAPKYGKNPFEDVPKDQYYTDAVLWAVERGITAGTSKTTFSPNRTCTRGQIVTFLYRDLA